MNRILLGILAGLALGLILAFGVSLKASPEASAETDRAATVLTLALQERTPHWRTFNLEDKVPALLVKVPPGKRFVLTDLWLLSHELLPASVSASDRMWIECVHGGDRVVVFDSPIGELDLPLRWNTGVSFVSGQEAWINYFFSNENKRPRRVHFTGYFESIERETVLVKIVEQN
jgi:hypothetical protein